MRDPHCPPAILESSTGFAELTGWRCLYSDLMRDTQRPRGCVSSGFPQTSQRDLRTAHHCRVPLFHRRWRFVSHPRYSRDAALVERSREGAVELPDPGQGPCGSAAPGGVDGRRAEPPGPIPRCGPDARRRPGPGPGRPRPRAGPVDVLTLPPDGSQPRLPRRPVDRGEGADQDRQGRGGKRSTLVAENQAPVAVQVVEPVRQQDGRESLDHQRQPGGHLAGNHGTTPPMTPSGW